MFLFRCCLRVDCGCQNETETEPSRSFHSSHDYLRPYEKQIQCRLLPQPVDTSSTKHFTDYSGCSHASTPRSLLVSSTQSADYEEVLLVSVSSPGKQSDELIYASVNDSVICRPPCGSGVANDTFSPDTSASNNNLLPTDTNDNVKLAQDGGSDDGSDVSSASSGVEDDSTAEVRYVADIRQFRPTRALIRPHGDECCCPDCQSVSDLLVHHSGHLKCSCKSCRDFDNRMQCVNANGGLTAAVGSNAFSNQYRLMSRVAQDSARIPLTWSSKFSKVTESASSDSQYTEPAHEDASMSVTHSDRVRGALASEVVDDDNEPFSSDEELRYVFHKFIDDGSSEKPFSASADDGLTLNVAPSMRVHDYTTARSADDLEVAFFMVGNVSADSPSAAVPDGSAAISASAAVSTEHQTAVFDDIAASTAELTLHSFSIVTEPSAFCGHKNLSAVQNGSEQYTVNIAFSGVETDISASTFETDAGSGSPGELESGAFRIEESKMKTDVYVDSDLNVPDSENQQTYPQLHGDEVKRDVIVQNISDTSSFFIELPATDDEHISSYYNIENIDISTSAHAGDASVTQECSPGEDDVVVGQCLEIVTPECIIEHPVSIHEVPPSSQSAADVSYGHDKQFATGNVASFICDIIANAVQQVTDDASVGICDVASENISSEWPITSAPLPCHWLSVEDEYDRPVDSLPSAAATDVEMQLLLAGETGEYCAVGTTDVDTDVDRGSSSEAICTTGVEAQDVPRVENYLISFDVSQSQQPIVDEADAGVDQVPMPSAEDWVFADDSHDNIKLEDLVRPLEHVTNEGEQAVDPDRAGRVVTFPPADIVEDFFMQYVLPVDSVAYSLETAATTVCGEQYADVADQPEVEQAAEDVVEVKQLENVDQSDVLISTVATEADVNTQLEAAATSAVLGMPYIVCHELGRDQGDEKVKELLTAAETVVDAVISDAVAETDAGLCVTLTADETSAPTSADGHTQLVVPAMSSCLLQSPSEPHRKKSVRFADMHGLQLETVQHYHQSPQPDEPPASLEEFLSKLSAAAAERRAKWTEQHPSRVGSWFSNSSIYLLACFELPGSQEDLLERVRHHRVALESCSFDDLALAISGVVCVANIAFHKTLSVRYTVNRWTTQAEVAGEYIPRSNDGPTDRFSFTIILPSRKQFVIGSEAEFAIHYVAGDGPSFEFWDNNHGRNYVVRCCSKAASSDVDGNTNADDDCNENEDREG